MKDLQLIYPSFWMRQLIYTSCMEKRRHLKFTSYSINQQTLGIRHSKFSRISIQHHPPPLHNQTVCACQTRNEKLAWSWKRHHRTPLHPPLYLTPTPLRNPTRTHNYKHPHELHPNPSRYAVSSHGGRASCSYTLSQTGPSIDNVLVKWHRQLICGFFARIRRWITVVLLVETEFPYSSTFEETASTGGNYLFGAVLNVGIGLEILTHGLVPTMLWPEFRLSSRKVGFVYFEG